MNQNIGDYTSVIVVEYLCKLNGIDMDKMIGETRHLYATGSILLGYQNATIWGSGFGYDTTDKWYFPIDGFIHKCIQTVDVRAVRGPQTRRILRKMGFDCPEVYGDPALLLPKVYSPCVNKNKKYLAIPHYSKLDKYKGCDNILGTFQKDYRKFVDEICSAEMVISASLHGIILAEAYGVPAIFWDDTPSLDITKYKDYYYSTGRDNFPRARTIDEALNLKPSVLSTDILKKMQKTLIKSFPKDLWENKRI